MFKIIKQILTLDKYDLDKWQNAIFLKKNEEKKAMQIYLTLCEKIISP